MKKVILTLIMTLTIGGSIFAQETHWPGFDWHAFRQPEALIANVQIDGNYITQDMDFASIEICSFVGDEQRGYDGFMLYYDGDPYPIVETSIYFTTPGETVSFKMFNHATGIEYDICTTIPETILTGVANGDYENPVILNFTSSFTKEISAYTENGGYYLIASPIGSVNPVDVGQMLTNNYDLYYFDQTKDKEWVNYKTGGEVNTNPGFSLEPGKGYLYANSENVTLTFSGAPYNDNQPIPLTKTQGAQFEGWNLIGNPYATAATVSVESFYRMNQEGRADLIEGSDLVDAMEGIFVIAESDDDEVTFTPSTSSKSFEQIAINLLKNRGNVIDRAVVRFGECRQLPKFQLNPRNTKIYVTEGDKDYAVVRSAAEAEMPVSFRASENGTYTLAVEAENVEMNYLHLIDNLTGMDVDLLQTPSYTFQAKTTDYASRFKLVFAIDRTNDESFAFFNNDNWFINNDGKALLQVIDLNGRLLSNEQISGSVSKHIDAAPGVYVIRLINGDNVKTQKVVVR